MTENKRTNSFLIGLFSQAQGDRTRGAIYMAERGITESDLESLTENEIQQAFEVYQQKHSDFGIDYTTDYEEFKKNMMGNLRIALRHSEHVVTRRRI